MSNEIMPPEPDLELFQALEELKKKREPWYMDRWMIASVSAIGGALFMIEQPKQSRSRCPRHHPSTRRFRPKAPNFQKEPP